MSGAVARPADSISFLSHWRLFLMEEPREWLLVCAGPLLHPERAREKPGDLADSHQGEWQGRQALWISVWWPTLPWEEADPMCGLHAHQGTLLLKITIPGAHSSWEATDHLWVNQNFFFLMLLKDPEIRKDFNFRKIDSTGNFLVLSYRLWIFRDFFFFLTLLSIWWLSLKINFLFVFLFPCCHT